MPVDFLNVKPYEINYDDLFSEINFNRILSDKFLQEMYLKQWKKVLIEHDNIVVNQIKNPKEILKLIKAVKDESETFQLPIIFQNNKILLHFRVAYIQKLLSGQEVISENVDLNNFTSEDSTICWTPVEGDVSIYSGYDEPIIMVPLAIGKKTCIVIDGNHRLTYKVRNNINRVNVISICEKSLIEYNMLVSSFDKLFYIMLNELNYMANITASEDIDPLLLIQRSYLTDGIYKFNN